MNPALIGALRNALGDAHVLTHEDPATDLSAWENDWRKRARGRAQAVARPGNTAEVAAVVKACAAAGASIVPQGGNRGLVVGSVPLDPDLDYDLDYIQGRVLLAQPVSAIVHDYFPFSTGERINIDGGFHIRRL